MKPTLADRYAAWNKRSDTPNYACILMHDLWKKNRELVEALKWLKPYAEVQVRRHPDAMDSADWRKMLAALSDESPKEDAA